MGLLDRVFGGGARAKAEAVIAQQRGAIMDFVKAKYDAAQTNELNKNHWSMADYLSADAALNPMIRRKLNARARYERDNNGYLSGMAQRLAADMVGTGPRLFLDCGEDADEAAVEAVEQNFFDYCDSIDLASKLREIRSSYTVDGDPFGLFTTNGARRGVQLDFVTVEAEQVADPRTSYGLAEATLYVATPDVDDTVRTAHFDLQQLAAGFARRCAAGQAGSTELVSYGAAQSYPVRIVNPETGIEQPEGTIGEIWVRGDNVALGYWRKPELTSSVFGAKITDPSDGTPAGPWLRTGDLGTMSEGELFIMGRLKDLLIVDGRNHYPDDIEATIRLLVAFLEHAHELALESR
jgi:acyl-CoA synthetase (AMP-forming)/AMP-acid ligase II